MKSGNYIAMLQLSSKQNCHFTGAGGVQTNMAGAIAWET